MMRELPAAAALAVALCLLAGASLGQGNESSSSSQTQGSPQGVLIGVGTTDETTSGSSGQQQVAKESANAAASQIAAKPGANGFFCTDIREASARSRCERMKRQDGAAR